MPNNRLLRFVLAFAAAVAPACAKPSAAPQKEDAGSKAPVSANGADIPVLPSTPIDAGNAADGASWLPKFNIRRDAGDQNATYLKAYAACASKAMALCTEVQWTRACSVAPQVGTIETWTVTPAGEAGFVVRGGDGCQGRSVAPESEARPTRAGVCCDPAVAMKSTNTNKAFLATTSDKMLKYQTGLNHHSSALLEPLLDDSVEYFAKTHDRAGMVKQYDAYFRQFPDQWTVYESCEASLQKAEDTWTADCATVGQRSGTVAAVTTRFVRGGPDGKLQKVSELHVARKFAAP